MSNTESVTFATCRLIVDGPADGAWNMAVDEALLESAAAGQACFLRFYQWSQPTLSLGYFQQVEERQLHAASLDCPLVRRSSGGGAILHDVELTYSLALPVAHPLAARPDALYQVVHRSLIAVLASQTAADFVLNEQAAPSSRRQPFLCFQRRAAGDVLLGRAKIAGSAQRRHRGAVLQHGSILLERSRSAPELPGLKELTGTVLSAGELCDLWTAPLARKLHVETVPAGLTPAEVERSHQLLKSKYGSVKWNQLK